MNKILAMSLFGITCFFGGIFTQYILPVKSVETRIECKEVPIYPSSLQQRENFNITSKEEEIEIYAKKVTVKVLSGENSGSGILINKNNNSYQVLTNDHVLLFGNQNQSYKIITFDGETYQAKIVKEFNFQNYDLGVLEFQSQNNYEIASFSELSIPVIDEVVYAAGFPYKPDNLTNNNFTFTRGRINSISDLSFRGGYQIGYSNDIQKGMSGGPLFNSKKEIIGINGRHKYPAWGNPYIFENGSIASPQQKEEMSQSSWAIPIKTFLRLAPKFNKQSNHDLTNFK
ncbi:peptidase S1 and S6 [Geminocystis sp. NIES-3708]|uniref:S1 family peptidase n=1 Tax=Geminocystis sp. NIES-3708 TaxID=1615909 RepID=UPI0005FCD6AE|nr:serine protease [Geminocystis sp. NIES-3708]BAQ60670.1 peptidase S1 and S6 [Geminocystis sp. NIES-3708]